MTIGRRSEVASAILVGVGYLAVTVATLRLTRFDGGVAFLWVANAILTARLTTLPYSRWIAPIAACFIASAVATTKWGFGPSVALPLAVVNVSESVVGAFLLRHFVGRRPVLDSHHWLITFVAATGIVAPLLGAVFGAGSAYLILGQPFLTNAQNWYNGHALGTLAFMPIFMLIMRGDAVRLVSRMNRMELAELVLLLGLVAAVSVVSFIQDRLPLLFLPLLPIVLATFRGGALSTAASIVLLTLIGGAFTLEGHGPIGLLDAPTGARMQFMQLYIACTMLTVLPANAELERRSELFRQLRESEARYRLLTEHSTDIIVNIDLNGRLQFVSASVRQIAGLEAEALIGRPFKVLLHGADAARAMSDFRATLTDAGATSINEYRSLNAAGEVRWFETRSRTVNDQEGAVSGVVTAIRDVTHRKAYEDRLARAALTDPLTGLMNRRGLNEELVMRLSAGGGGCVALFDLDYFKQVNDTYGHASGDEVLRRFAALARSSVRDQDIVARIGGEEFAVILPDATIDQARLVCDRVRRALADSAVKVDGAIISVTVSGGVTVYGGRSTVEDVLRDADRALYRAKNAGRDQLAMVA